ncbi:MAG: hypothetical protein K2X07_00195 [Caulobacteraceae bacterium]|nr:hypothetical protein [Caulobacteraceae bacterium]
MVLKKKKSGAKGRWAKERAEAAQSRKRSTRLALPPVDPELFEDLDSPKSRHSRRRLLMELATTDRVDAAVARSHRYLREALAAVYATWFELARWSKTERETFLEELRDATEQKTVRGGGLHILLRALITYEQVADTPEAQAAERRSAVRRVGRDAAALKFAARHKVRPADFAKFVATYPGGLDRMSRDEAEAERASVMVEPTPTKLVLVWPSKEHEMAVLDALEESEGVALLVRVSKATGRYEVVMAHDVNRSPENWNERLKTLDPLPPFSV